MESFFLLPLSLLCFEYRIGCESLTHHAWGEDLLRLLRFHHCRDIFWRSQQICGSDRRFWFTNNKETLIHPCLGSLESLDQCHEGLTRLESFVFFFCWETADAAALMHFHCLVSPWHTSSAQHSRARSRNLKISRKQQQQKLRRNLKSNEFFWDV